jgi:DNA-binding transcriptional LysR family regulator
MQLQDRIGCRMKLRDIHVLIAVVQAGSMGKAAAVLNTGQPAISRSIAELERALGVRLLERNRQGIKPTDYGRALLSGGTAVFDNLRHTVKSIAFLADPAVGEVRIGCNPTLAPSFVSVAINQVSRRYPRATFRIVTAYVDRLHRELIERNVDFLIARRSGPVANEQLDYEFLFDDPYLVAVGEKNPLARRREVALAELVDEPWVLPAPETTAGALAMEAFRSIGLDCPRTTVTVEPAEVRINLVATGRFISIFTDSTLRFPANRAKLKVVPVKPRLSRVPVGIITVKGRIISPLPQLFIAESRKLAKQWRQ